jgi:hypothetical protein
MMKRWGTLCATLSVLFHGPLSAQAPNMALLQKQQAAMRALNFLDGEWVGPAEAREPKGTIRMTQTERSGTLLGGTIRLVEGRSFDATGATLFNAFAVISYDSGKGRYLITSYASGYATSAEMKVSDDGFSWDVPAGPGAKMHFVATVKDGVWRETGDYVGAEGAARRTFDMTVKRVRATTWPDGRPVYRASR